MAINIRGILKAVGENLKTFLLKKAGTEDYDRSVQDSKLWLRGLINKIKKVDDKSPMDYIIRYPGTFYMFNYEPAVWGDKSKLKFYDGYPLVLVLDVNAENFLCINFHWIHPRWRAVILQRFIKYFPKEFTNDEPVRKLNYKMFMTMMGGYKKYVEFAVRRYKWDSVVKMRGVKVVRVKSIDMPKSISYISPDYIGITNSAAIKQMPK